MNFRRKTILKAFQPKNRNQRAFHCLVEAGFTPGQARRALVHANQINLAQLADGVTPPTLYSTNIGFRRNARAMEILASALDMDVEELFPKWP